MSNRKSNPRVLQPAAEVGRKSCCFGCERPFFPSVYFALNETCSVMLPTITTMSAVENLNENGRLEEDTMGAKRKMSLSTCGVCGADEAKYKCPACVKHSCSLMCVKKHKDESGCSGLRDKTAFVALSKFDEMNLLNDYRFLEDTIRLAGSSSRDRLIRMPDITFKVKKLTACARKMNITLKFLPVTFTKSRENSTIFLTKEKRFLWHLKLIFPQSNTEFSERRISDGQTIEQILTPYIHPSKSDPVRRQQLKMYAQATFEEMKVFMRVEGEKANSLRYHELELGKSLRDNLIYKMLIEYPVLHIVLQSHFQDYPLKGPAKPVSDHSRLATGEDQGTNKVAQALPSCAEQGLSASLVKQEVTDEIQPPREKRAKREGKELEEGELTESSEEEGEQGEERDDRNIEDCHTENTSLVQTCLTVADGGMGPVNSVSNAKDIDESY